MGYFLIQGHSMTGVPLSKQTSVTIGLVIVIGSLVAIGATQLERQKSASDMLRIQTEYKHTIVTNKLSLLEVQVLELTSSLKEFTAVVKSAFEVAAGDRWKRAAMKAYMTELARRNPGMDIPSIELY